MAKKSQPTPDKKQPESENKPATPPEKPFPVIAVGASAGGLKALEGFFSRVPADCRGSFVVIQHMDPKHKSMLAPLLSQCTKLAVSEIEDGVKLEEGKIYVIPPNRYITIMERKLFLIEPEKGSPVRLPIDHFFSRLSEELGERAIGIVLSGTGSDGTLGIKAIKGVGGLTIAQEEEQAEHSGMPASAIASGCVDVVTGVEKMPEFIAEFLRHPYAALEKQALSPGDANLHIPKMLNLIRTHTGNDFSKYKQNTTRRRIERRMAVHRIERMADYLQYLHKNSAEVDALFKDLLIGVTNFFRDPKAFEFLAEKVIPEIVKSKPGDMPVRVWVPACATGEEAYSIAILLTEAMEVQGKHLSVQIFATDIDHEAIQFARDGVFPDNIVSDVSEARLARFFKREGKTYRISKQIREMIVFAVQNVIKDPPFSRIDLLSCRNLLIYLEAELQKKLMALFHYTINQEGFLFLGLSESASAYTNLFSAFDTKWKVFRCKEGTAHIEALPPFESAPAYPDGRTPAKAHAGSDIRNATQRILLEEYAPPSVLVNEKFEIIYYQGQTQKYLQMPTGEPNHSILKLVRRELHHKLSLALNTAQRQKKAGITRGIRFKDGDVFRSIDLIVRPLPEAGTPKGSLLVLFVEGTAEAEEEHQQAHAQSATSDTDAHGHLEQELAYTRETLQTTIEELETSNEELKSSNEELQSTNEELQSTNEELVTSKEEMNSTNEELVTVNSELQRKVSELEHVNNDISNLLAASDIGTLFLDNDLRIKRFTPAMTSIFNLIASDIGRPIRDITSRLHYRSLENDARDVLRKLISKEIEIELEDGRNLSMRILPYRTLDNVIDGVVITFVNAAERHQAHSDSNRMTRAYKMVQDLVPASVLLLDGEMNVIEANAECGHELGIINAIATGEPLSEVVKASWGDRAVRQLENALRSGKDLKNHALKINSDGAEPKALTVNSLRIEGANEQAPMFLVTLRRAS